MKIKKNTLYDTFRCISYGKKETMNDILKGTKTVLTNQKNFKNYINNYSLFTKKQSFKLPDINDYPLLNDNSSFLIPIKKVKINKSEDIHMKKKIKPKKEIFFSDEFYQNKHSLSFKDTFKKRFYQFLKLKANTNCIKIIKRRQNEKQFKRYNSLFLDFFDKWNELNTSSNQNSFLKEKSNINKLCDSFESENTNNETKKNNINILKFNIKERYYGLQYNENEIFNTNYDKFISDRINYIKTNKIKNYQLDIESSFNDLNEKQIKLKLKSIKINFYPQNNKGNNNDNDNNLFIYLPLSFAFLFYFKDINYLQKILLSIIYFEKDFKKIYFNDEGLYKLLEIIDKEKGINEEDFNMDFLSNNIVGKKSFSIHNNLFLNNILKGNPLNKKEGYNIEHRKTFIQPYIRLGNRLKSHKFIERRDSIKEEDKKIKIIHSNVKFRKNYNLNNKCLTEENIDITKDKNNEDIKENFYNEYYFMWETPDITYKVKIEMPKLYFSYEDLDYKIVSYCDKNLFLYLYKKNFINWDFYALNYFFSIKSFRKIILKFLSLSKEYFLINSSLENKKKIKNLKNLSMLENIDNLYDLVKDEENKNINNIFLKNKKIYNQANDNNESYIFFYSDKYLKNYITHFYSYHIKINYEKLNPKYKWEFYLNFKQMRYLNEVSKYVSLISFLPKIIKTNSITGNLSINFNVFEDNFNAKILKTKENKSKKEILNNKDMNLEINNPYIEIENILTNDDKLIKKELNYKILQNLNKIKIGAWSKKLFEFIDKGNFLYNKEKINKNNYVKHKTLKKIGIYDDNHKLNIKIRRSSKQKLTFAATQSFNREKFNFEIFKNYKSKES